jgi:hypothetical protein
MKRVHTARGESAWPDEGSPGRISNGAAPDGRARELHGTHVQLIALGRQ